MPSRVDKRVAPEGAADKQCQGEGKLITICDHKPRGRQGETTSDISQDRISIRISRTYSIAEDWREREMIGLHKAVLWSICLSV